MTTTTRLDHVPILEGTQNYQLWEREMKIALMGEDLWKYVSSSTDPKRRVELAAQAPVLSDAPTDQELDALEKFQVASVKTAALIRRKLSPMVSMRIPRSADMDPRAVWGHLQSHFSQIDTSAQFALIGHLEKLRLKDASDAERYLAEFSDTLEKLLSTGMTLDDRQQVYLLLKGLPEAGSWGVFRQTLQHHISEAASGSAPFNSSSVMSRIQAEARRLGGYSALSRSGPGSEYANVTSEGRPVTSHRRNASGVACSVCGRTSHDKERCWEKGGGAEGQMPAWMVMQDAERAARRAGRAPAPLKPSSSGTAQKPSSSSSSNESVHAAFCHDGTSPSPSHTLDPTPEYSFASLNNVPTEVVQAALASGQALMDSGATSHVIRDRSAFWTYDESQRPDVRTACQGTLPTLARGDCVVVVQSTTGPIRLRLRNCLHAPQAQLDLLSVGKFLRKGFHCDFRPGRFVVKGPKTASPRFRCEGPILGDLAFLDITFLAPALPGLGSSLEIAAFVRPPLTRDLWHARLGHAAPRAIMDLVSKSEGMTLGGPPFSVCEPCIMGKHPQSPHPSSGSRASHPLDLVHGDICGPFPVQTPHGKLYFIAFLDDHTHAVETHLLATRDQALEAFQLTHRKWERQFDRKLRRVRLDNAGEFKSDVFTAYLRDHGIVRESSAPYAHEQNGKAERLMRTLQGRTRSMMTAVGAPPSLWGEAVLACSFLFMLTPSRALPGHCTPYEMVHGRSPDLSRLRVWGCRCFARVPTELQTKLGSRSRECRLMGFPEGVKGYRVRDVSSGTFFNSCDVIFDEGFRDVDADTTDTFDADAVDTPSAEHTPVVEPPLAPAPAPSRALLPPPREPSTRVRQASRLGEQYARDRDAQRLASERRSAAWRARHSRSNAISEPAVASDSDSSDLSSVPSDITLPSAPMASHVFDDDYVNLFCEEIICLSLRSDTPRNPLTPGYDMTLPPATYKESQLRSDALVWQACVDKELALMKSMNVYVLAILPPGWKAIGNRWVFEFKLTEIDPATEAKVDPTAKGRLVAKGFNQIPGIDFGRTFAPVVKASSVRLLAALACYHGWILDCFDATRAFLWGELEEEIYMKLPDGFRLPPGTSLPPGAASLFDCVWRLTRSIYGLKQASLVWYSKIRGILERLGLVRSEVDHALFHFRGTWRGVEVSAIIALHVDDGLGGSNHQPYLDWVKSEIRKEFGLKDLGPVRCFLGVEFERDLANRILWMHQATYIKVLLEDHGMSDCNSVRTPMDTSRAFSVDSPTLLDRRIEYQAIIGKLLFLSLCTRPDISYTVNSLAQHASAPRQCHFDAVKRTLWYLKGTATVGLRYQSDNDAPLTSLIGFCDSDWAGEEDRKSVSGHCWFLGSHLVDWSSKKQSCIALSSTEAEYVALGACVQTGIALRSALVQVNLEPDRPIVIGCDNEGATSLAANSSHHSRAKHIDIKYHFIRSHVRSGAFSVVHVPSRDNCADVFTKPLPYDLHTQFCKMLCLVAR